MKLAHYSFMWFYLQREPVSPSGDFVQRDVVSYNEPPGLEIELPTFVIERYIVRVLIPKKELQITSPGLPVLFSSSGYDGFRA